MFLSQYFFISQVQVICCFQQHFVVVPKCMISAQDICRYSVKEQYIFIFNIRLVIKLISNNTIFIPNGNNRSDFRERDQQ
jgi:hypothetical protein